MNVEVLWRLLLEFTFPETKSKKVLEIDWNEKRSCFLFGFKKASFQGRSAISFREARWHFTAPCVFGGLMRFGTGEFWQGEAPLDVSSMHKWHLLQKWAHNSPLSKVGAYNST